MENRKIITVIFKRVVFSILLTLASQVDSFAKPDSVYPVCSQGGNLLCPDDFEPACIDKQFSEPKCILLGSMFIPGCWKFIGIKKIDLGLDKLKMPGSTMVEIIGGGETYTLDREGVFCKRI